MSTRDGYNAGFQTLLTMLLYCYELGVKYITAYAFSIDNFKRNPEEVEQLMDFMVNRIDFLLKEDSTLHKYQVRVHFSGNFELLNPYVREAAKKLVTSTAAYSRITLIICVAYTSTDEIVHAIRESGGEKRGKDGSVNLVDIEKHMYMGVAPDPDIVLRTSGESRLSNFLLWQSSRSVLMSVTALWPEMSFWHLVWAILNFQRNHSYIYKKI